MSSGFKIDGDDLSDTYGIEVTKTKGIFDHPKRKGKTEHSWLDSNGVEYYTESADIRFEARDIYLHCFIKHTVKATFLTNLNNFKTALQASGLRTLTIPGITTTFDVYFRDGFKFDKLTPWDADTIVGTFILRLREPDPELSVN